MELELPIMNMNMDNTILFYYVLRYLGNKYKLSIYLMILYSFGSRLC